MTSKTRNRPSSEVRERAVRVVVEVEHAGDHPSRRAALIGPRSGRAVGYPGGDFPQSRSSSLTPVFARVWASTRFTMTAQ